MEFDDNISNHTSQYVIGIAYNDDNIPSLTYIGAK